MEPGRKRFLKRALKPILYEYGFIAINPPLRAHVSLHTTQFLPLTFGILIGTLESKIAVDDQIFFAHNYS